MKKIKKRYSIIGAIVVVIIVIIILVSRSGGQKFESALVAMADVIQYIDVTGKIAPEQKADLAFEKAGIVANISVKVGDVVKKGDILGSLDTSEARASYQGAEANLLSEQAKLEEIQKGTRTEELNISEQAYANDLKSFQNTIRNTFTAINSTLRSTVDSFFDGAESYSPQINDTVRVKISSNNRIVALETMRLKITESIDKSQDSAIGAKDTLTLTKSFLDTFLKYMDNPTDSQRQIILTALEEINTVNRDFIADQKDYEASAGQYSLKKAGSTSQAIRSQIAKTNQASAQALSQYAILQKMTITAPFDGIVTLVKPTIGELASANTTAFTVMTGGRYKIEVFVPESNISKISIGNMAKVALDAYGKDTKFDAMVSRIDPAETVVEGIPTYKITLSIASDPRIRSGMTADVHIFTAEKRNVLSIPTRAILEKDGRVFVRKVEGEKFTEVPVTLGLKGSNGNTEIISGVNLGDYVRTN